jgi:hypothetical protein
VLIRVIGNLQQSLFRVFASPPKIDAGENIQGRVPHLLRFGPARNPFNDRRYQGHHSIRAFWKKRSKRSLQESLQDAGALLASDHLLDKLPTPIRDTAAQILKPKRYLEPDRWARILGQTFDCCQYLFIGASRIEGQ